MQQLSSWDAAGKLQALASLYWRQTVSGSLSSTLHPFPLEDAVLLPLKEEVEVGLARIQRWAGAWCLAFPSPGDPGWREPLCGTDGLWIC